MSEKVDHGFISTTASDGSVSLSVNASGIGFGAWFGMIFLGLLIGVIPAMIWGLKGFVFTVALFGFIAFLWDSSRKKQYIFTVSDAAVRAPNGKEYAKADISELLIRNQSGNTVQTGRVEWSNNTTVVVGSGAAGMAIAGAAAASNVANSMGRAAGQVGSDVGAAIGHSLAKRGNEVCIRYGRKVVPLARHLREDDAIAVFNRVRDLI